MNDVSPEILEAVKKQFDKLFYQNAKIKRIYEKVRKGKASFAEMKTFAEMAGDILSEALDKVFTEGNLPDGKLYQNIAEKVITPMLQQNYSLVNEVCGYVMDDKNAAARIGVKAVTAEFNADRAEKIAQIAANSGGVKKGSKAAQLITNMSLSFVDDFIRVNADLHKDLGMRPQIQRIYHGKPGACGFCEKKVYSDDYKGPKMPEGIFQRHKDCKCTLIYKPQKGKYQDPWSKKEASEYEKLISDQRGYLTELDKMTPAERKLARNARARERRRSKYSASEWSERKAMQSRMQRIKEKEVSLNAGGKAVRKEKQAEIALKAAADKAAREKRIIARVEELQQKRKQKVLDRKAMANYNNSPDKKAGILELKKAYEEDVKSGWISPLSGFNNYLKQYIEIQRRVVGMKTTDGVEVKQISRHFMQRVMGTGQDPKKFIEEQKMIRRSGVDPKDIAETVEHGTLRQRRVYEDGNVSCSYAGEKCIVTINPDTGMLVQCNPI